MIGEGFFHLIFHAVRVRIERENMKVSFIAIIIKNLRECYEKLLV